MLSMAHGLRPVSPITIEITLLVTHNSCGINYLHQGSYVFTSVCLSVCLLAKLCEKFLSDYYNG